MDEILKAVYQGALAATEKSISLLQSIDDKAHEIGKAVDDLLHEQLAYLQAVATDLRSRLGIVASGAVTASEHASAAAAFVDSLGPSGS